MIAGSNGLQHPFCLSATSKQGGVQSFIDFAFFDFTKVLLGCPAIISRVFFCLNLAAKGGE